MIIIPSEKRLNWRRPPIMLIGLLLLNLGLFFTYQNGDDESYNAAVDLYQQHEFLNFEAEAYIAHLKQRGILSKDPALYESYIDSLENRPEALIPHILIDRDFLAYLENQQNIWIPEDKRADWQLFRPDIDKKIASLSSISFGHIPAQSSLITLFSHQFLHGGIMHLIGNMLFLLICGFTVEAALGPLRFLLLYLLSGVSGALLFSFFEMQNGMGTSPLIGASGAISGVMAMYLMLYRLNKIEFFYWALVFIGYFRAPALWVLPFYIAKELIMQFSGEEDNVAYMAHVGGFLAGAALIAFLQWREPKSIDQEYLEEDDQKNPRLDSLENVLQQIENTQFGSAQKRLQQHLEDFGHCQQSDFIHVNLLALKADKQWQKSSVEYLARTGRDEDLINNQYIVWNNLNSQQQDSIAPLIRCRLALRFLEAQRYENAEAIAINLFKAQSKEPMLSKLLAQLAFYYRDIDNHNKQQQFENAQQEQLNRCQ